jgi:1-acyl-sn-glycerol-3-phosphate acyltransferase
MGLVRDVRLVAEGWRWSRRSLIPHSAGPHVPPRGPRYFPTGWARTAPARVARESIRRFGLGPLLHLQTRPRVAGLEHLDALTGPVVFVANHASHLDAPLVLCTLPRAWAARTAVGAANDYFFDVGWRGAATALAFNAFPVDRYVDRHGRRSFTDTSAALLAEGWSLLLFPEGTRSPDGWMAPLQHGTARLCTAARAQVVPVAVRGTYAAMPRGRNWPRPGRLPVAVRYGPPIRPDADERTRAFARRIDEALCRLWREEDTTWWESLRATADGTLSRPAGPDGPQWRRIWESTRPLDEPVREPVWPRHTRGAR